MMLSVVMNKSAALVVVAVIAVFAMAVAPYAMTSDSKTDNNVYGIIGAMPEETATLLEAMNERECVKIGDREFHIGTLEGKKVVISECGYGKVNAGVSTQLMITEFGVTAIINSGVAGTLDARVGVGDIVVSTDTVQQDYDMHEIGFERGLIPNVGKISIDADERLRMAAVKAIRATASGAEVFEGRVCTGDQFISGADEMKDITDVFGGMCCEMEGGAIAQICYLNNVPFVIVRAISDDVDGGGPADYAQFEKEMAALCASMTIEMMKQL